MIAFSQVQGFRMNANEIWSWLTQQANRLGLECIGVSDTHLQACEPKLQAWLNQGMQGEMQYMAKYGLDRVHADTILPGAVSIVSFRINYVSKLNSQPEENQAILNEELQKACGNTQPFVSLYARGRDYHKTIRQKLTQLMNTVHQRYGELGYRITIDSAPTPEVEIARKAGLGWRGKHTLLIHPKAGSLFFLAEVFTNLPLPISSPFERNHCGNCTACVRACPTQAIVQEGVVDARRCISYLTIEHRSSIPVEFRPAIGLRIYGCDDCQLVCPWNKFAQPALWADFNPRAPFESPSLTELLNWSEAEFLKKTEGMAIRRIGFEMFQRNLAIACGNSQPSVELIVRLQHLKSTCSDLVKEHIDWALQCLQKPKA